MASSALTSPLASTWNRYKEWSGTARELKSRLDRWRLWTLILAVMGTVLVTLGQQIGSIITSLGSQVGMIGKIIGLTGAGAVALSTYFAREALSNESVQRWAKCRSAAESMKASTYLYRAGVPPFEGADRDEKLIDRRAAIEETMSGVELLVGTGESDTGFDPSPLSVEGYCQKRVNDQIQFYQKRVYEYHKKMAALRVLVFWLGAIAVILGVFSALKPLVVGWTAVIATVTAAILSYVQSQHYQTLITTYQATSSRLETLRDKWIAGGKADANRNAFIQSCEDTLALENGAWVTQWSQQRPANQ
jgi:hypothetical protein